MENMYRQVLHHPEDLSFIWILHCTNSSDPIEPYELQTVTYRTVSAPYPSTKTFQQIALDQAELYPAAVEAVVEEFLGRRFFVWRTGLDSAVTLRQQITAMLGSAGFTLKKWSLNAQKMLQDVLPADLVIQPLHNGQDEQAISSTLGLLCHPKADNLRSW